MLSFKIDFSARPSSYLWLQSVIISNFLALSKLIIFLIINTLCKCIYFAHAGSGHVGEVTKMYKINKNTQCVPSFRRISYAADNNQLKLIKLPTIS